jgi:serine/threonine protein kinase
LAGCILNVSTRSKPCSFATTQRTTKPAAGHRSTVAPENVLVGLDDRVRLGHLTSALDQHSDRPASRLGLLDYMAPEMMAVRGGAERDLALAGVLRTAGGDDGSGSEDGRGDEIELMAGRRGDTVVQRLGYGGWGDEAGRGRGDKQEQLEPGSAAAIAAAAEGLAAAPSLDWMASPQRAAARLSQHSPPTSGRPSPAPQPLALGSKLTPAASAASASDAGVGSAAGGAAGRPQSGRCRLAKYAPAEWEGRDYYNEKVDVWQLGCLVHELLCGSMPFEVGGW